jgi:hypothetical protein
MACTVLETGVVPKRDDVVGFNTKPCRTLDMLRVTECFWPNETEKGLHYVEIDELLLLGHYCCSHKDNQEKAAEWREDGGRWMEVQVPRFAKAQLVVFRILPEDFDLSRIVFEDRAHNILNELPPLCPAKRGFFRAHVLPASDK